MNDLKINGWITYDGALNLNVETQFYVSASLRERVDYEGNLVEVTISWPSGGKSPEEMIEVLEFLTAIKEEIILAHSE